MLMSLEQKHNLISKGVVGMIFSNLLVVISSSTRVQLFATIRDRKVLVRLPTNFDAEAVTLQII